MPRSLPRDMTAPERNFQEKEHEWSSTTNAGNPCGAWYVNLSDGIVLSVNEYYTYYVWPVRGGP